MATRRDKISLRRVATITAVLALAAAAGSALLAYRRADPVPVVAKAECLPIPSNIQHLGAALSADDLAALSPTDAISLSEIRPHLQPGDSVHQFETEVTGGLIGVRGSCYVAQHTSWIR